MLGKRCEVCGSVLDEEDLFCPNCGREAPVAGEAEPATPHGLVFKNRFVCHGCGAAMSYDASAGSLRCPFCGSTELKAQPDGRTVLPTKVVPFTLSRNEVVAILRKRMEAGFFLPSDLTARAVLMDITPVYVPFWNFSADTHTYWTADSSAVPVTARGSWRPLFGEKQSHYEGILVGASHVLSFAETRGLGRYDFSQGVSPDRVDLDNVTVEQFRLPRKYARSIARRIIEQLETEESVRPSIPGHARNIHVNVKITRLIGEPVLLPVWILAYRYNDRVYRFVVNGQTGQSFGELPISIWKVAVACLVAAAILLLIILLIGGALH